jgi:uncharacterized protein YerC
VNRKTKLSREEAEEYTHSLGQVTAGDYGLIDFAINTLGVPNALNLTTEEWVTDHLGGYIRWSVSQRRKAVAVLLAEGKSRGQISEILGISADIVSRDKAVLDAEKRLLPTGDSDVATSSAGTETAKTDVATSVEDVRRLIDEGKTSAEIMAITGFGKTKVGDIRREYKTEQEANQTVASDPTATKKKSGGSTKQRKPSADAAEAKLDGYLAAIEGNLLGLAAWWRQEGQEALADRLAWVDETVEHTETKAVMVLRSVRGINTDADAALGKWVAEAEGEVT